MFETLKTLFSYGFIQRALIAGLLISVCAALLGVNLVLKRYSMIGDGLSHVGFGTTAIALAAGLAPLYVSIPVVLIAAFLLLRISENGKIKGDALIALISSSALAIGVITVSLTTRLNADIYNYLFGSILTLTKGDMFTSIGISCVVLLLYILFYNKIFAVTFDSDFAKASGTKTGVYNLLLSFLTALIVVVGMQMMGAMLISSLVIFPSLTAMRVFKSYKSVVIASALLSAACFLLGMIASFLLKTPAGATVVVTNLIAFCIFFCIGKLRANTIKA